MAAFGRFKRPDTSRRIWTTIPGWGTSGNEGHPDSSKPVWYPIGSKSLLAELHRRATCGKAAVSIGVPTGGAIPNVSTLNSFSGQIVANAVVVAAGTGGSISVGHGINSRDRRHQRLLHGSPGLQWTNRTHRQYREPPTLRLRRGRHVDHSRGRVTSDRTGGRPMTDRADWG
jgi:hypothetical protein